MGSPLATDSMRRAYAPRRRPARLTLQVAGLILLSTLINVAILSVIMLVW